MIKTEPPQGLYREGVGALLVNRDGRVFVGRRTDTAQDAWQMPQGGIEKGEDPAAAVLRELEEEIGTNRAEIVARSGSWRHYDLPADIAARMWKGRFRGQKMMWFVLRFMGHDRDIAVDRVDHPEFNAWKWVEAAELPALIVPFKRALYADVLDEFAPMLRDLAKD